MKKLIYIGIMAGSLLLNSSCSDWLDLLPKNEQVTDAYWKSKEDVEAVIPVIIICVPPASHC